MGFFRDLLGGSPPSQESLLGSASKKHAVRKADEESRSDSAVFVSPLADRRARAIEKYELALSFFDSARQFETSQPERRAMLEGFGIEALVEAMVFNPKFLKPHLVLAKFYFAADPVRHARPIVENLLTARLIDPDHRETMLLLADVLEVFECRNHFLRLTSFDADEIDGHIQGLRDDTV